MDSKDYWRALVNMSLSRLLILRALSHGPTHGYAILQEVSRFTKGCCAPTYGTIYPVLKELERGKYCESEYQTVNGRRRKVYQLNEKGEQAYQTAMEAWAEVLPYLNRVLDDQNDGVGGERNGE